MKISWGYKIAIVYFLFIVGIGFLAIKASSEKFDLVTKDYYEQELKYQQVIDQAANTSRLSAAIKIEKTGDGLTINFPEEMNNKRKKVDFYLYCPADAREDFRKVFEVNDAVFSTSLPEGLKGMFEVKLSWVADNIKYYHEQKIYF